VLALEVVMLLHQRMIAVSMAAAVGLMIATAGYAQTAPQPAKPAVPGAGLNLTQAQRDEIRALREAQRTDVRALREKLRGARQALREAMSADVPDEAAVRAAAGTVAALQADETVLRARAKGQFMKVLTPEQRARVKDARARAAERAQRMRMRANRMMRQEFTRRWWGGI
jgi:protein CpxP